MGLLYHLVLKYNFVDVPMRNEVYTYFAKHISRKKIIFFRNLMLILRVGYQQYEKCIYTVNRYKPRSTNIPDRFSNDVPGHSSLF